jgi:hypothetical protein
MSGIEAYRIQTTMGLDISQTLSALKQQIEAFKTLIESQKSILAQQKLINSSMVSAATAANKYADAMERAARAAAGVATNAAAAAASAQRAASAAAMASVPLLLTDQSRRYLPAPAPMLGLPAPSRAYDTVGGAYGPGTGLVATGQGRTNTETTGRASPEYGGLAAYGTGGGLGYRGGETAPGGVDVLADPYQRQPRGPFPTSDAFMLGYEAQRVGNASSGLISSAFDAAASVQAQQQALLGMQGSTAGSGFNPERVKAAYAAAVATQQNVLGSWVGQNLSLVAQLMALTQDATTAIAVMPEMARAQAVFTGLGRDGAHEISDTLKTAELRGVLFHKGADGKEHPDLAATRRFLHNMEAIVSMTGGRYGASDIYQFMRSGGIPASVLSDDHGFAEIMPYIQSMRAGPAGTALQAFGREFPGGRMSDAAFSRLIEMGIIAHPELAKKIAIGYHQLLPGAISNNDFNMSALHPESFILGTLRPRAQEYNARVYGADYTKATETERLVKDSVTMMQIASMIPGGKFMGEALRLDPLFGRDAAAFDRQKGIDAYKTAVEDNPKMRMEAFNASVNALLVTLGTDSMGTAIAMLKAMTEGINRLNNVLTANPALGTALIGVAAGLAALGTALGVLLPIIIAYKSAGVVANWMKGPGGGGDLPGAGLPLGKLLGPAALAWEVGQAYRTETDPTKDANGLYKNAGVIHGAQNIGVVVGGILDGSRDLLTGALKNLPAPNVTVHVSIDGKDLPSTVKTTVDHASGPLTGTGNYDSQKSYLPTEH